MPGANKKASGDIPSGLVFCLYAILKNDSLAVSVFNPCTPLFAACLEKFFFVAGRFLVCLVDFFHSLKRSV